MKSKKYLLIAFALLVLAQLFVPFQMIFQKEKVLKDGIAVKFRTAPIDPNDPFRGKYIYLNYDDELTTHKTGQKWEAGIPVKVYLKIDEKGFAHIDKLSREKLSGEENHLYVDAQIYNYDNNKGIVHISYPFDRFYMEEHKAPEAEKTFREQNREKPVSTYAIIKVLDGDAVIEDVIAGGKSVTEL